MMRLELVKRAEKSRLMSVLSPLLAVAATGANCRAMAPCSPPAIR